jgi:hypothetical protein
MSKIPKFLNRKVGYLRIQLVLSLLRCLYSIILSCSYLSSNGHTSIYYVSWKIHWKPRGERWSIFMKSNWECHEKMDCKLFHTLQERNLTNWNVIVAKKINWDCELIVKMTWIYICIKKILPYKSVLYGWVNSTPNSKMVLESPQRFTRSPAIKFLIGSPTIYIHVSTQ